MNRNNRIEYLDVAKGIGIILVVWAHAGGPFHDPINLFHMPFFFLVSGLLYNSKASFWQFTWKKIKALYIPFVFWNTMFLLLTQLNHFSSKHFLKRLVKIVLTLDKEYHYLGAIWFLGALFTESVLYKLLDTILTRVKYRHYIIVVLYIFRTIYVFHVTLPGKLSRTMILGLFFAVGVLVKELKDKISFRLPAFCKLLAFAIFLLIAEFTDFKMGDNRYSSPFLFMLGAFIGCYLLLELSKWLVGSKKQIGVRIKSILEYCSLHSIDIVIWHFVFFRVAIIIQLLIYHEPVLKFLEYGKRYNVEGAWWILYLVIGMVCPILWGEFLRRGPWGAVLEKLCVDIS